MALDFPGHEDAMRRTLEIAERCNVEIELGTILLPKFPVPEGRDAFDYLVELCEKGLGKRYGRSTPELEDRLRFELKTIREMGFADYFLIVWDFIHFAKRNGVSVGPGRGSAAGSLAAYCLEITDVDPIQYGLLFERFLNPGRKDHARHGHRLLGRRPRPRHQLRAPRSTGATASRRSSPSGRWRRAPRSATPAACSTSRTASSTGSRS